MSNARDSTKSRKQQRLSLKKIELALQHTFGYVPYAATYLSLQFGRPIKRQTVERAISRSARLQACIDDINETILDRAEALFILEVLYGDIEAIKFLLRTRGADRGYADTDGM